jgi:hypothetical protein
MILKVERQNYSVFGGSIVTEENRFLGNIPYVVKAAKEYAKMMSSNTSGRFIISAWNKDSKLWIINSVYVEGYEIN